MHAPSPALIQTLPEGPLDIVGDVHGEIEALRDLLKQLGYAKDGAHPEGRRLVFVGDLCDRGPDSPSVIDCVANLVEAGRAYAVLGNHELSVLRGLKKDGNDWFYGEPNDPVERYGPMRMLPTSRQDEVRNWLNRLPVVLERKDLRVVHAAWDEAHYRRLQGLQGPVLDVFDAFERVSQGDPAVQAIRQAGIAEKERRREGIKDPAVKMEPSPAISAWDEVRQMANPIRVMTSGWEKAAAEPFFAGGAWRFVERAAWWEEDRDPRPVVFGHYWRRLETPTVQRGPYGRLLFYGFSGLDWFGRHGQAFCVDFSVGGRYAERLKGRQSGFIGQLAALRFPERVLVFDDGRHWMTASDGSR